MFLLCLVCLWCGCPTVPSQEPVSGDAGVTDGSVTGQSAFVLSMWEESGVFGVLSPSSHTARKQLGPVSNDAVARYYGGYVFVINRLTHDNIQVMDVSDWSLHTQYSVGPRSNPQDMAFVSLQKAYISRLAEQKLMIVSPLDGTKLGDIDLSSLSETNGVACQTNADCDSALCLKGQCAEDGIPELAQMVMVGDKLVVAVQRLNRNKRFAPVTHGLLAVIDTKTDKLVQAIPTQGQNPTSMLLSPDKKRLYVVQVGAWNQGGNAVLDGLIEAFSVPALQSQGVVLRERDLGGNLSSFAISSSGKGFAIRSNDKWQTELVSVSLQDGKVGEVLATSPCVTQGACYSFFQVKADDADRILLVDRDLNKPGVRIFSGSTGKELTTAPIDMGLPPSFVLLYP